MSTSNGRNQFAAGAVAGKPRGRRQRVVGGQDVTLKRTFYLWVLIAACLFMIVHQVQQTKRVVRSMKNSNREASELDMPVLSRNLNSLLWQQPHDDDEQAGDDVFADDDNEYDDDDDDDYDSNNEQALDDSEEEVDNLGVDAYVKKLKDQMDETARQNNGKVSGKLYMDMYQKALKRRRQKAEAKLAVAAVGGGGNSTNSTSTDRKPYVTPTESTKQFRKGGYGLGRKGRAYRTKSNWRPPNMNTTNYRQLPPLPLENRTIPDMSNGGVIFFLHVPKTGGQTIRQFNLRFRMKLERKALHTQRGQDVPLHTQRGQDVPFRRNKKEQPAADPINPPEPPSPELMELDLLAKQRMRFVVANTLDIFHKQAVPQVNHYLESPENTQDKILFVEVHGMDNYHAFELEPYLQYWREQSRKSGVPFFAFTLLREALSLHVSFFNYYYIHPADPRFCKNPLKPQVKCTGGYKGSKRGRHERRQAAREEYAKMRGMGDVRGRFRGDEMDSPLGDFMKQMFVDRRKPKANHANGMQDVSHEEMEKAMLQVAYSNPQCLFLARGERTFGDGSEEKRLRDIELRRTECQEVYMSLQRTMDWIGRTDTLSTETLPLLTHMMFQKPHLGKHLPKANVSPPGGFVKLSKIQPSTRKGLEKLSQFDQEIYHRIVEDYSLDQWVNKTDYGS